MILPRISDILYNSLQAIWQSIKISRCIILNFLFPTMKKKIDHTNKFTAVQGFLLYKVFQLENENYDSHEIHAKGFTSMSVHP